MMRVILLCCLVAVAFAHDSDLDEHWNAYANKFNKNVNDGHRRTIWEENVKRINDHNLRADLGLHSYRLGLNHFADMTNAEFRKVHNGLRLNATASRHGDSSRFLLPPHRVPSAVDWRTKGYVTGVKDQGQCGSCWAFSATGSVEGAHFKATGKLVSLSEQNLVDCSDAEGNMGCGGGLMDQAFQYIMQNKGVDTEASYPYTAEDGSCHFSANKIGATISSFVDVSTGDETALQQAVATAGPVSIGIDASSYSFQLYSSGVYDDNECSSTQLDHGVLAVGYDTTSDGKAYWIVKNSWGASWGQKGYIWMSRNKQNQCGVATAASYPVV